MDHFSKTIQLVIGILICLNLQSVNSIHLEQFGNMNQKELKGKGNGAWGFEKNIINIDTFFANPLKHDGNGDPIEDYEQV